MKTLFLFATFEEAECAIEQLKATQLSDQLYEWETGYLMITGIGSFAAYIAASHLIDKVDSVCHLGLAGTFVPTLELGKAYEIATVSKRLWHPKAQAVTSPYCPDITLATTGPRLISSDVPVYSALAGFDLVDMEAYAAALLAQQHNKRCKIIKVVSDSCDANSSATIRQNLKKYSDTLGVHLMTQDLGIWA